VCIVEDGAAGVDAFEPPPDEIVARNASWLRDLPAAVRRALGRAHARQHAELHALLEQERAARADLEQRLTAVSSALDDANQRQRAAAATAAEQLANLEQQHESSMLRAAATREMLDEQLGIAASELERARVEHASAAADVDLFSRRERELSALIADATAVRLRLERRVADDADRRGELEARLAEEIEGRSRSEQSLAHAAAEVEGLTHRAAGLAARVADLEAHCEALTRQMADARHALENSAGREKDLEARIEREGAARAAFEQAAADAQAAVRIEQDRRSDLEARIAEQVAHLRHALEDSADREKDLDARIEREGAARAAFEQAATESQAALRVAQERHDAALAASARKIAERQAQFDRERAATAAAHASTAERLTGAEAALEQLRRDHRASTDELERLTRREADLESQLADLGRLRDTLERRLTNAANALHAANDGAARERVAAAERQADLEARLAHAHEEAETLRTHAGKQAARLENQMAGERHEHQTQMAETHEWNRRLLLESDALQQSLSAAHHRADQLDVELAQTREQLAQVQSTAEADVLRLTTERLEIEHALEDARRGFQAALESFSNEHDAAVAALAVAVGERDQQLAEEEARFAAAQRSAEAARAELQTNHQSMLAERDRDIEQLQATLTGLRETLEAGRRQQEVLLVQANQTAQLRKQLDDSRAESDRVFQQAPLPLFRCMKDGALVRANRAWVSLVYRNVDELRGAKFAATIFESPTDLSGLIEQCLSTNASESIETTLRRKDGARLFVRLSAFASPMGLIEIAVENLTRVRVLQDRLERAHRMEAVGRLSSEVALNCAALLNDVHQKARQSLVGTEGIASHHDTELLLDDVRRAIGSLQQLAAYGDKKSRTRTVLDLNGLVRDLAPVLKEVAGEEVEIQLRGSASSLSVDIETERIERLLVNLAAHGRERMRSGGTLTIDVGAVLVDLGFTAKHPHVRPGPHALITVSEMRRPPRADRLLPSPDGATSNGSPAPSSRTTGIDLGALQRLVGGCGGHLWMKVQPQGDIVAKVRLPLVTSYDEPSSRALATLGDRGRTITRWFQR
jgi:hypothetical protein